MKTEQNKFNDIFNEPLTDRRERPDPSYTPPQKKRGETWNDHSKKVAKYNREYKKK